MALPPLIEHDERIILIEECREVIPGVVEKYRGHFVARKPVVLKDPVFFFPDEIELNISEYLSGRIER